MRIDPLEAPKRRPRTVALLEPGIRSCVVHTEDGSVVAAGEAEVVDQLEQLAAHKVLCYVPDKLTRLRYLTDARQWSAVVWKERCVAMEHPGTGFRAVSLRGALKGASDGR
ncbi:MAG: hypothetical protein KGI89_17145, partial [Euryarchaeota archaeon]|nr:hypothetical protein [Euryarchaeota archaeon]